MRYVVVKKVSIITVAILFIFSSFISSISGFSKNTNKIEPDLEIISKSQDNVILTCQTYGLPKQSANQVGLARYEIDKLFNKMNELAEEMAYDPTSSKTEQLQEEIISFAKENKLLSEDFSKEDIKPAFASKFHSSKVIFF